MKYVVAFVLLAAVAVVTPGSGGAQPDAPLSDFMRVKLKHSQRVLEGLVSGDYDKIAKNAQDMSLLSLAETWQVLETPQYVEFSRKFRAAADKLAEAGKKKNLDQAANAYNQVTLRCVECHKYVRDVRMASLPLK
jgi:hypothetical protein